MRYVLAVWWVILATGCPDRPIAEQVPVQHTVLGKRIPVTTDLDILFVIDDSQSTRDKQALFAQNYQNFVDRLESFPTRPNMHIGVVTTSIDLGDGAPGGPACHPASATDGRLQNASRDPGVVCSPTSDRFLSDLARPDGTRQVNYSGTLAEALSCISHVGEAGCGFEAPLEAMKRALDGSRLENDGFLRQGAVLAIVMLTDEDDCSADPRLYGGASGGPEDFRCTQAAYRCDHAISASAPGTYTDCEIRRDTLLRDPDAYATFLSSLEGPPGVAVALIAGDPKSAIETGVLSFPGHTQALALQPSCRATILGNAAVARPAIRLDEFRQRFGDHGLFSTVCQSDYSQAVDDIGTLLFNAISPCLEGTIDDRDIDDTNVGRQIDCSVTEVADAYSAAPVERVIRRCAMRDDDHADPGDGSACWWVKRNPSCATATQLELEVERAISPAPGTVMDVSCSGLVETPTR
ncbi:MAG: hypothetical protein ABIY55_13015 [Kofleriaceae bacterium]